MELKSPLNIEEQLAELNRHHIQVDDPAKAREILTKIGYYRLSGYWLKYFLFIRQKPVQGFQKNALISLA